MKTIKERKEAVNKIPLTLMPDDFAGEVLSVHATVYDYENKYDEASEISIIEVKIKQEEQVMRVYFYQGIGYRDSEEKTLCYVGKNELIMDASLYYAEDLDIQQNEETMALQEKITDKWFDGMQSGEDESSYVESLQNEWYDFIKDTAVDIMMEQNLSIIKTIPIEQVTAEDIAEVEAFLAEMRVIFEETKKDIVGVELSVVLDTSSSRYIVASEPSRHSAGIDLNLNTGKFDDSQLCEFFSELDPTGSCIISEYEITVRGTEGGFTSKVDCVVSDTVCDAIRDALFQEVA